MYYLSNRYIIMKHVTKYLNVPLIETAIVNIVEQRIELMRKNAALRSQLTRLKQILKEHQKLDIFLKES